MIFVFRLVIPAKKPTVFEFNYDKNPKILGVFVEKMLIVS